MAVADRTNLSVIFGQFFEKILIFHARALIFQILYVLRVAMLSHMPKGLVPYRLLDRDQQEKWSTPGGQKIEKK